MEDKQTKNFSDIYKNTLTKPKPVKVQPLPETPAHLKIDLGCLFSNPSSTIYDPLKMVIQK